jgi:signal transduction histidine kinase
VWYLALFLSYILFGHLLSAISFQSQVIPIWLPAGIALVGCYLWWWRFFPAVFLASFIFNISILPSFGNNLLTSNIVIQNGIIATGSMLQAIIGAGLLRYWLGNPFKQSESAKTLYFVFIIGILINLISASIGVYSLSIFNPQYDIDNYLLNMFYWWLGDSLGVLLVTPIFFSILNFNDSTLFQKKTRVTIISSVSVLFVIVVLITQFFIYTSTINSNRFVKKEVKIIENGVHRQINSSIDQLRQLANFIQNSPNLNKESFQLFVEGIYTKSTAIKAMSWNPIINQSQQKHHEKVLNQLHSKYMPIKGVPIVYDDPIIYVKLISPEKDNEKAIGFNVFSNPSRKKTLKSAMQSYQAKATPIIQLVQSDKEEPAFLLFFPVFDKPHSEQEETTKHLKGFATAVFLAEKMLTTAFTEEQRKLFNFEFYEQNKQQPFFDNALKTTNNSLLPEGELEHFSDVFFIAGQKWNIKLFPNTEFVALQQAEEFQALYLLLVVIIITIITSLLMMNNRQLVLDDLVNQRTESLKEAVKEANYANKAKSQFLANMSHEIRTPMNSVIGFAQLAHDAKDIDEIQMYLDNIAISSDLLLHIINDILDISKIESEKLSLNCEVFDLHLPLERIHHLFEVQASTKQLTWSLSDNLPQEMFVKGDQTRLEQILMNLCGNAMKFTKQGGVGLTANIVKSSNNIVQIEMKIIDTGIGILKDNIPHLFKPFSQADSSTSRDFGGTGLGLTISKKLSQLMGGDIQVLSTVGQGSTFIFTCKLPIAKPLVQKDKNALKSEKDLSSLKVLVAEDNRINQKLIETILKKLGIDAVIVENGQLAIDYIKREYFDVVLMDCQMPVLDGYDATVQIRAMPEFNDLMIFALTADVDTRNKDKAMTLGFNKHLAKPIDIIELTESLQGLLK